jgi:hypothetical protein
MPLAATDEQITDAVIRTLEIDRQVTLRLEPAELDDLPRVRRVVRRAARRVGAVHTFSRAIPAADGGATFVLAITEGSDPDDEERLHVRSDAIIRSTDWGGKTH